MEFLSILHKRNMRTHRNRERQLLSQAIVLSWAVSAALLGAFMLCMEDETKAANHELSVAYQTGGRIANRSGIKPAMSDLELASKSLRKISRKSGIQAPLLSLEDEERK